MIKYHSVNGVICPVEQAQIKITDLGLLRGYGIFDYFQIKNGNPIYIDDHIDRFYRSAGLMQLEITTSKKALKQQIQELVKTNGLENSGVRLILTGGYSLDGFTPTESNLLILQHPFKNWDPKMYEEGSLLITHEHVRTMPEVKTTSYFVSILLNKKMKELGATDVLYHDAAGWISETSRSNFFIISKDEKLITANKNILKGITRMHTLQVAEGVIAIEERDLNISELETAKEAFITSTTKGILPIVKVGNQIIGNGEPGEMTKKLGAILREKASQG